MPRKDNPYMPEEPMVWIDEYEPREWVAVYELTLSEDDEFGTLRSLIEKPPLVFYGAESVAAESYWFQNKMTKGMFLFDLEQIAIEAAGFDIDLANIRSAWGFSPSDTGILNSEWRGHPEGSFIYTFFRGVDDEPRFFTVAVATPREDGHVGNIAGLNKASVLATLYNAALTPRGKGFLQHESIEPMTEEEAVEYLFDGDDSHRMVSEVREVGGRNHFYFQYLKGRPLKVDISGDHVGTALYNRENGDGTAERAIEWLRRTGQVWNPDLSGAQQERLIQAGFEVLDQLGDEPFRFNLQGQTHSLGFADHVDELRAAITQAVQELSDSSDEV